jgi:hypothetical protein
MLQESGVTTAVGTQAVSKPSNNPGGDLAQALVGETVQQTGGVENPVHELHESGVGDSLHDVGGEAGAASKGSGTGGGAGTGGTGGTGGPCFPAGTTIDTVNGKIPIESVIRGMYLGDSGSVLSLIEHASRIWDLLVLSFDEGELQTAPEHRIFCRRFLAFVSADSLVEGDELRTRDGWVTVQRITKRRHDGPLYNLLTSNGTYLANGVLVHNYK